MSWHGSIRWPYAVSGLLAAVAGMAVGQLVAVVVDPPASPVLAVGSAVVDATPTPVKEWAVSVLGTADKPVLITVVTLVTAALAASIGLIARTRPSLARVLLVLLVGLAGLAALSRPASAPVDLVPSLAAAVAGLLTLSGLVSTLPRKAVERRSDDPEGWLPPVQPIPEREGSRRAFLTGAAGVTLTAAAALTVGRTQGATPQLPTASDLPRPAHPLPPLPAGLGTKIPGITPFRTPVDTFYRIDTALILPRVDPSTWTLTVDGEVDHPFSITWDELLAMPMIEADITLNCVSNPVAGPYIGSARWLGVRTRDLLARARVRSAADQILSTSTDGMTISTPVQALTDERDAIVAIAMDGKPLPRAHGFPARLVTPGLYGFVGATKWLSRMTATTYATETAYWTERGWATDAPVRTQSRIDVPGSHQVLQVGRTMVGGVAWAQGRGIRQVQVRIDDGPWRSATLGPDAGIDYWRQWYLPWNATSGRHTLTARATDGTGATQTEVTTDPFPSGATGWHSIEVTVS